VMCNVAGAAVGVVLSHGVAKVAAFAQTHRDVITVRRPHAARSTT